MLLPILYSVRFLIYIYLTTKETAQGQKQQQQQHNQEGKRDRMSLSESVIELA